jgi:hypothetical protein
MMTGQWTGVDGFPREWPEALELALKDLAGDTALASDKLERYAKELAVAANIGRMQEIPAAREASQGQTDKSLEQFYDRCGKLIETIASLKRPAWDALRREGTSLFEMQSLLAEAQQAARHCHSYTDAPKTAQARPRKEEAAAVTEAAARVYTNVTGQSPTFTTLDSGARGRWPDFLGACFAALHIVASVESQAKALREKSSSK